MLKDEAQKYIVEALQNSGIEANEAQAMARLLLAHKLGVEPKELPLLHDRQIEPADFAAELTELQAGYPLQYLLGETEFMGLTLRCTPSALIPRGDSEVVAEAAIELMLGYDQPRIADICCGAGSYALALAQHLPGAHIDAVDISAQACALAEENAERLGLAERITIFAGDLFAPLLAANLHYELIVSNPPYIASNDLLSLPQQVKNEPAIALDGGADGLFFYRRLAADAQKLLKKDGYLLMEHGADQAPAVADIMRSAGLELVKVINDYGGRERGTLVQAKG